MIIFLALVILSAVLALSGIVVLFALAAEAEVLPSLSSTGGAGGDEAASEERRGGSGIAPRNRTRVSLSNQS
jgi:hypothetical protein